jgi:arylsulfatase A-like enzyme
MRVVQLAMVVLGFSAAACAPAEAPRPNILFVVTDTVRADHMTVYGYERPTTPNLKAFAETALVFKNARAPSSWTKPSTASMLTGLSAAEHGVDGSVARLPAAAITLAETLLDAGYRTGLFSDNPIVSKAFGFAQGYQHRFDFSNRTLPESKKAQYVEVDGERLRGDSPLDWTRRFGARRLNNELLGWLEGFGESQPWFAHVQYMDAHWPYAPPVEYRDLFRAGDAVGNPKMIGDAGDEKGVAPLIPGTVLPDEVRQDRIDLYDGSIAHWDNQFGEVLARLEERGRLRNTIVVVVSDHGEGFYDHEVWDHENSLYDELVRVPFIMKGPGIEPGHDDRTVTTRVLPMTLLELAGLEPTQLADGATLFGEGEDRWTARVVHEGRTFQATLEDGHKWIFSGVEGEDVIEVFDLEADAGEQADLSQELEARAKAIRARLREQMAAERASGLPLDGVVVSESMEEALRALGYVD